MLAELNHRCDVLSTSSTETEQHDEERQFHGKIYSRNKPYDYESVALTPVNTTIVDIKADDDLYMIEAGCHTPQFITWKRQLDGLFGKKQNKKKSTAVAEWKTTPKRTKASSQEEREPSDDRDERSTDSALIESRQASERNPSEAVPDPPTGVVCRQPQFPNFCSYMLRLSGTEKPYTLKSLQNAIAELNSLARPNQTKNTKQKKSVHFAYPMVTQTTYRPRTSREDMLDLFFQDEELQSWECDRETTSPEQVELFITKHSRHRLHVSVAPVIARRYRS